MTPRQRILATLAHHRPDRVPTDGWFHPEVIAALKRHFATADWSAVLEELGIVGWAEVSVPIRFPDYEARATPRPTSPFQGEVGHVSRQSRDVDRVRVGPAGRSPTPGTASATSPSQGEVGHPSRQSRDDDRVRVRPPAPGLTPRDARPVASEAPTRDAPSTADEDRSSAPPDAPIAKRGIWLDSDTYDDEWGVRHRLGKGGRYEEWISGPLQDAQSAADVDRHPFPTAASVMVPADLSQRLAALKKNERYTVGGLDNPFKRLWHLRGYENALMDYLDTTEILEAVYDRLMPLYTKVAVELARAGVDMIQVVGDVSMQDRITMGPGPWRRFDKPRLAGLIAAVHAVKKDVTFFFHSDGNLTDLVDDLVEIGFTVINPIQPECMDPLAVKKRWGRRITLHGCISIQRTLPFGTPGAVRAEVEGLIESCGRDGGLILMPSNVIQPDTPIENVLACYRAAREFEWGKR